MIRATVVRTPFYDPENLRQRRQPNCRRFMNWSTASGAVGSRCLEGLNPVWAEITIEVAQVCDSAAEPAETTSRRPGLPPQIGVKAPNPWLG
jgi:hypothetical protein